MKFIQTLICIVALACITCSGFVNINFQHNLHLPKELTNKTTIYSSRDPYYPLSVRYDIYLNDKIGSYYSFRDTIRTLDQAHCGDAVYFHLAGTGGNVETAWLLINHIKECKACVTMLVEAPCYSAHAYIATSGDRLVMSPYTFLMFHTTSLYGYDPSKAIGTDRTVPNTEHMKRFYDTQMYETNKMIMDNPWLTNGEKFQIMTGHSIYLTREDIVIRSKK
jgi:ATP-dependent protease ClpP protease subunit